MLRKMQRIEFSGGEEFDTSGKLRIEEKNGKMYVVGEGVLIMVDDKKIGEKTIKRLKQEKLAMHKEGQEAELRKWIETKGKIDEFKRQIKKLEAEGKALEKGLLPQIKELEDRLFRVDAIFVEWKEKRQVSVKYKPLWEKTISFLNAKIRKMVEAMAQKEPYRSTKTKEYLELREAPPLEREGQLYPGNWLEHSNKGIRALAYLTTDKVDKLRQTVMLDDSALVRRAAFIALNRLQPKLVESLKTGAFRKYAQQDPFWQDLVELDMLIDILETMMVEAE